KQVAAVIYDERHEALELSLQSEAMLREVMSSSYESSQVFFHALALTALYNEVSPARQREFAEALNAKLKRLKLWVGNCPENFQSRFALVSAEKARIEGRDLEAMRLYDEASRSARENGFVHIESLANERATRFYLDRGLERIAYIYLRDARAG